jgi:endonuclease/exonuclease/phosphatase (EEP) superfamily protein YafD
MYKIFCYLVAILILLFVFWIFISMPGIQDKKTNKNILRIAAKNILFNNRNNLRIVQDVVTEQIDIILLLEYNGKNINLKEFEHEGFKPIVVHPRPYTHGILLIAKEELTIEGIIQSSPVKGLCRLPFAVAHLCHQGKSLALFGVHIPPPTKRCRASRQPTLNYFASLIKDGYLIENIGPARKGDPAVILGDFNTISFESALDTLYQSGFEDAYSRHQWRPGPTWSQPTWFPAVFRLDFILVSRHIETTGTWAVHVKGSDHRGVVVDVLLRE